MFTNLATIFSAALTLSSLTTPPSAPALRASADWGSAPFAAAMPDPTPMPGVRDLATTATFAGVEAKTGTATLAQEGDAFTVRLSDAFVIPKSPAPHFQIVDGQGNVYLLDRLTLVGDKTRRKITLPAYIKSVSAVRIWCSYAEVLLGEAKFAKTVTLAR